MAQKKDQQKKDAEEKIANENLVAAIEAARKLSAIIPAGAIAQEQLLPPNLSLPSDPLWNVLLLGVTQKNEVLMRLADTSDNYLDFLDKLAVIYEHDDQYVVTDNVVPGRIYATVSESCVLRVQALDENDELVQCVYVDEGGEDLIPKSSLRYIPKDIAQLPFQAFKATLDKMRDHATNPKVGILLQKKIDQAGEKGLVLVAEPMSRQHPPSVLLYDTSGEIDVLINESLFKLVEYSSILNIDLD